jgi:hypothetical protein
MRKLIFAFLLGFIPPAAAQTPAAMYCYQGPTNPQWAPCSNTLPLPTTATISGSVTVDTGANATAAAPSYSEGQVGAPISQNLVGDQVADAKARADEHKAKKQALAHQQKQIIPPTQDPMVKGALWNNNGTAVISAGS